MTRYKKKPIEWKSNQYDFHGCSIDDADLEPSETEVEYSIEIGGETVSYGEHQVEVHPQADCISNVVLSGETIFGIIREEHGDEEMAEMLKEWMKELVENGDVLPEPSMDPWRSALDRMHELNVQAWELAIANSTNSSFQSEMESVAAIVGLCELCGEKKPCKKCGGE